MKRRDLSGSIIRNVVRKTPIKALKPRNTLWICQHCVIWGYVVNRRWPPLTGSRYEIYATSQLVCEIATKFQRLHIYPQYNTTYFIRICDVIICNNTWKSSEIVSCSALLSPLADYLGSSLLINISKQCGIYWGCFIACSSRKPIWQWSDEPDRASLRWWKRGYTVRLINEQSPEDGIHYFGLSPNSLCLHVALNFIRLCSVTFVTWYKVTDISDVSFKFHEE